MFIVLTIYVPIYRDCVCICERYMSPIAWTLRPICRHYYRPSICLRRMLVVGRPHINSAMYELFRCHLCTSLSSYGTSTLYDFPLTMCLICGHPTYIIHYSMILWHRLMWANTFSMDRRSLITHCQTSDTLPCHPYHSFLDQIVFLRCISYICKIKKMGMYIYPNRFYSGFSPSYAPLMSSTNSLSVFSWLLSFRF